MFLTINDIKEISAKMTEKIGVEYTGYSINYLRRRVSHVIEQLGLHKVQELLALLDDSEGKDKIAYEMMIPGTEMFRDPGFWRVLRKNLSGKKSLNIWLPNLTNGYELYSLLVLLRQMAISDYTVTCNILSSKVESDVVSMTFSEKTDEVHRSNFERLESGTKYEDFFEQTDEGFKPKGDLLKGVKFVKGWFIDSPVEKYDLIIFRNILLEFGVRLHEKAVNRLAESLNPGGLLAIGIKESLVSRETSLKSLDKDESIYTI